MVIPGAPTSTPPPHYVAVVDAPYACFVDRVIPPAEHDHVFPPGLSYTFSFDLKVTGGAGRTTGWVRAAVSNARLDSNPTNDIAAGVTIVVVTRRRAHRAT